MLRLGSRSLKSSAARGFQARFASYEGVGMGSTDGGFEKDKIMKVAGEGNQRDFTYFMLGGARFVYASAARLALIKLVASMSASADVLALASAEFEVGAIAEGSTLTVKWRGKPVFIRHRTAAEIAAESAVSLASLKDPQSDADRAADPAWLVVLGICTHLGCVPISGAGEYNGWFCPCHGSHYDTSGRIRRGPAPLNLEIPPYTLTDGKLQVG
ncbi:Rieske [2Fe-2S] iron-sulfur domain-containing protein [Ochromonadaceae sp. CCMP2298]|nr:Rieske [2Fe-2S] iron-sulfur domain-containing protein [Ochromonadaceae sp. CCMP2298]